MTRRRTAYLIRKANVAALSTLRVGQVDVVLGQKLLTIMPFVEARWFSTAFRLGKAAQKGEDVIRIFRGGGGSRGRGLIVMKEESDCGEKEEAEKVTTKTTRQDGVGTKWR